MSRKTSSSESTAQRRSVEQANPLWSLVSLFLFIHLFCVLIALSANVTASPLQLRFLQLFRPYLQSLNFDPDYTPFHLTHGGRDDVDHRWEARTAAQSDDSQWQRLPDHVEFRGSDDYKRRQRLARAQSVQATSEDPASDAAAAELARGVAAYFVHRRDQQIEEIRTRRHLLQTWAARGDQATAADRNPHDPSYFETSYAARVIRDADGNVRVVRRTQARDAAMPQQPAADNDP